MTNLDKKVALVTASNCGIGLAIVEALAKDGAVVYMASCELEEANERAQELNSKGNVIKTVFFDAYQTESITGMIDTLVANEGRLDILVNNFGGTNPRDDLDILYTDYEKFEAYVNVHLKSVFISCQHAIRTAMQKQKINIGSIAGLTPDVSQIAYGTAKAAINHMSQMIATSVAKDNITCNVVCPGITATKAVTKNLTPEFQEFFLKHTPIHRMGMPKEIADAVLYFAKAPYTTGQILAVHGGFGIPSPVYGDMPLMKKKR